MTSTLWVAFLTVRATSAGSTPISARTGCIVSMTIVAASAIFTALPLMGVGEFRYTGEGFCYFNWYDKALSALMLVVTLPTIAGTLALLIVALRRGGWPASMDLYLMA